MYGGNLIGSDALFNPFLQRPKIIDDVWARATAAMLNTRSHEQAEEVIGLRRAAHEILDALAIVDAVLREADCINPAVPDNQLASARFESREVRIRAVDDSGARLIEWHISIRVERVPVPVLVRKDQTFEMS
jgi:hypothetical protein